MNQATTPSAPSVGDGQVAAFDTASREDAVAELLTCLAVPRWADEVADARPYGDWDALRANASQAADRLTDAELESALARHPRIGERAGAAHDAEHSRREQAGVDPSDTDVAARLAQGNAAYEARFDRVFLIRAKGRTAEEILGELDRRLTNDDATERAETVTQLREIALLRLEDVVTAPRSSPLDARSDTSREGPHREAPHGDAE